MPTAEYPPLEESIVVAASPEVVWALVSDPRNMARWSPQVTSTRVKGDDESPRMGTRFTNLNTEGELTWVTHAVIVEFAPPRHLAFRIEENSVIWSFRLEPGAGRGTRLTQRRDAPDGISAQSLDLTDTHFGGQEAFTALLRAGMRETLERLKLEAEQ